MFQGVTHNNVNTSDQYQQRVSNQYQHNNSEQYQQRHPEHFRRPQGYSEYPEQILQNNPGQQTVHISEPQFQSREQPQAPQTHRLEDTSSSQQQFRRYGPFHCVGESPFGPHARLEDDSVSGKKVLCGNVSPHIRAPQVLAFTGHLDDDEIGIEFYTDVATDVGCLAHLAKWSGADLTDRPGFTLKNNKARLPIQIVKTHRKGEN